MYSKENWQSMGEKEPPFGYDDNFQTSPRRISESKIFLKSSLTRITVRVILYHAAMNWENSVLIDFYYNRLSRKGLDIIYRLIAVPQALFVSGVKVNDRPIRYFFGEACHDLSLRERAKESHTTQRRAGLPVRNRIG